MATMQAQTVCRMFPIKTSDPGPELITLLTAASKAALEFNHLTPLGEPMVAIRPTDDWVIDAWVGDGKDPAKLTAQVLLFLFQCVPVN